MRDDRGLPPNVNVLLNFALHYFFSVISNISYVGYSPLML